MQRTVEPEILDDLPADNPEAIRSRADLRVLNRLIGGEAWIVRELHELKGVKRVVELGAGEGLLATAICEQFSELEVCAVDLVERPAGMHDRAQWLQANVLESELPIDDETVVVVNLFLHHLKHEQLVILVNRLKDAKALLFAEPARRPYALVLGYFAYPFVGRVTKHDMMVSIRAGFVAGELEAYFSENFQWVEVTHWMGGLRSKAVKA
ncbi:hypothetical protein ACFPK9_14280 [Rubritalea spongiae]|uniref:Methyltransferase domain-containing protein n=1 Tax=Rubritalea spongiae TaxID=430797 RepID=A0ABW5E663_9BACT